MCVCVCVCVCACVCVCVCVRVCVLPQMMIAQQEDDTYCPGEVGEGACFGALGTALCRPRVYHGMAHSDAWHTRVLAITLNPLPKRECPRRAQGKTHTRRTVCAMWCGSDGTARVCHRAQAYLTSLTPSARGEDGWLQVIGRGWLGRS